MSVNTFLKKKVEIHSKSESKSFLGTTGSLNH